MKVPVIFKYVMKYVTPLYLGIMLVAWLVQDGIRIFRMEGMPQEDIPFRWAARLMMLALFLLIAWGVRFAWKRKRGAPE
jgi:hypothetical protein